MREQQELKVLQQQQAECVNYVMQQHGQQLEPENCGYFNAGYDDHGDCDPCGGMFGGWQVKTRTLARGSAQHRCD